MRHWDVDPGEAVVLRQGAWDPDDNSRGIVAVYRARDTLHAFFEIEGRLHEFDLLESGNLRDARALPPRIWHIAGADRNRRGVLPAGGFIAELKARAADAEP